MSVLVGFAVGLTASVLALRSILKDRALLLYASLLPGVFVVVTLIWEAFVPH